MNPDVNRVEQASLLVATRQLEKYRFSLASVGLRYVGPEHKIWSSVPENYTTELKITFFRDGEMVDMFEFHLFRNGVAIVSPDEVEHWMGDQLENLLMSQK